MSRGRKTWTRQHSQQYGCAQGGTRSINDGHDDLLLCKLAMISDEDPKLRSEPSTRDPHDRECDSEIRIGRPVESRRNSSRRTPYGLAAMEWCHASRDFGRRRQRSKMYC